MDILHRKAAIQKAFAAIGKKNGSAPPESAKNTFGVAYELLVSKDLASMAEKRYEAAKKAAEDAGVIDKSKVVVGEEVRVYESEYFDIALKKNNDSQMLDRTTLKNFLMKQGASDAEAEKIIAGGSKPRAGATNINISLK
jgi:hypothetical protein